MEQHYLHFRITIIDIYQISGIRRTNHTITLYKNVFIRPLSLSTRDKLTNLPRHCMVRHQSWRKLHNDARLLDNLNPPTVDNKYKTHIPDTVNHNYICILVRSLHIYMNTSIQDWLCRHKHNHAHCPTIKSSVISCMIRTGNLHAGVNY